MDDLRHAAAKLELSGNQLGLFQELERRNPRLAGMYVGAVLVLSDTTNPERLPLAAHELRELMEKIPQIVDIQTPGHNELFAKLRELEDAYRSFSERSLLKPPNWSGNVDGHLSTLLDKAEAFFRWYAQHHPRRREEIKTTLKALDGPVGALPADMEGAMIKAWMESRKFFQNVAHHLHAPSQEDFDRRLAWLEDFLLKKLSPQTFADFDAIDSLRTEGEKQ